MRRLRGAKFDDHCGVRSASKSIKQISNSLMRQDANMIFVQQQLRLKHPKHSADSSLACKPWESKPGFLDQYEFERCDLESVKVDDSVRKNRDRWRNHVRYILDSGNSRLLFQPIVSLREKNEQIFDMEVLLSVRTGKRWVSPSTFVAVAEQCGYACRLDKHVIDNVVKHVRALPASLRKMLRFHINLSAYTLGDPMFFDYVATHFADMPLLKGMLHFEITESATMVSIDQSMRFIEMLKLFGCTFSLDDFGKGHCSYARLRDLPVDRIKIDGSFVKDIDRNPVNLALLQSIVEVCKVMGKRTVAEWVESNAVRVILRDIGVDFGQGFALGRPSTMKELCARIGATA